MIDTFLIKPSSDAAAPTEVKTTPSRPIWVGAALVVWWIAQQGQILLMPSAEAAGQATTAATADGSVFNVIVVLLFAGLGAVYLLRTHVPWHSPAVRVFGLLLAAYLLWSLVSMFWTVDAGLSIRRYGQLLLIVVGCTGLGLGMYGAMSDGDERLAWDVLVAGLIAVAFMWLALARSGNIDLLSPTWAAKDSGIGTRIGYPAVYAALAAVYLRYRGKLTGWRFVVVLAIFGVSLFAQKARFTISFGLVGLVLLLVTSANRLGRGWLVLAGLIVIVGWTAAMLVALQGPGVLSPVTDTLYSYVTLDAENSTSASLNGRTPLWDELWRYAQDRPWLGYGFGAFWNPVYMPLIWAVIHWPAPVAHDGFLDEVLGTGLVGLSIFLAMWVSAIVIAWRQPSRFGALVAVWLLLFLFLNIGDSIMQSYFQFPFYVSLLAFAALLATTERASRRPPKRASIQQVRWR